MFKKRTLKDYIYMALLISINIILVRFFSFQTSVVRISFGFIPISLAGIMFGPFWGGITAVLSDIIGMLINSKGMAYFFPFTISEFLYGFTFGIFFYNKKITFKRILICVSLQFILINLCLTSYFSYLFNYLIISNPKGYFLIFGQRLLTALCNFPLWLIGINLIAKYVLPHIKREGKNYERK